MNTKLMKTKLTTAWSKVPSILAVLMFTSVASHAAISFTEDFSDFSPSPNMALGTGFGSPTTTFASGTFNITSGISSRIYLGTIAADYNTTNFVFEADVTVSSNSPWSIAFIGMGSPNATGGFGEPSGTVNIGMALRSDGNRLESRDNGGIATAVSTTVSLATHGISMSWNATTSLATFGFDSGNDGSYESSFTVNGADNGFTASNSQLFIGGGNGLIFDNLTVTIIPEPSAPLLGGLGVLLLLRRRRN